MSARVLTVAVRVFAQIAADRVRCDQNCPYLYDWGSGADCKLFPTADAYERKLRMRNDEPLRCAACRKAEVKP